MSLVRTKFAVPDIRCNRCKRAIEDAVGPIPGVGRVHADVRGWVVTVDHDPALVDASAIAAAVEDEGHPVTEHQQELTR
jgi:copper chaperone CopZ